MRIGWNQTTSGGLFRSARDREGTGGGVATFSGKSHQLKIPSIFGPFIDPLLTADDNPIRAHHKLMYKTGKRIPIDQTIKISTDDTTPQFAHAVCGPCLAIAVVSTDGKKALFGHFSTNFLATEIYDFLVASGISPDKAIIRAAGLAQKSGPETLARSIDYLQSGIQRYGIKMDLQHVPDIGNQLFDVKSGNLVKISDLGGGLLSGPEDNMRTRMVTFGLCGLHSMFISTSYGLYYETSITRFLGTTIFMGNSEAIEIQGK